MITSTSNTQIKNLIQLQKKNKARKEQGVFVAEGRKLFEEIKELDKSKVVKVYFSEQFIKAQKAEGIEIENYAEKIPFEIVQDNVFLASCETLTPQGILSIVKQPVYSLDELLHQNKIRLLILEDLRDPGNLGTIIRTAEGAGVTGILLSKECVDLFNPKVIRSTMGAIFRMPFVYTTDFLKTLSFLKTEKVRIYAAHLESSVVYSTVDYRGNTAFLIGNEANGLSRESTALADQTVRIPMGGQVESLNAAVAAAILMYERAKQLEYKF